MHTYTTVSRSRPDLLQSFAGAIDYWAGGIHKVLLRFVSYFCCFNSGAVSHEQYICGLVASDVVLLKHLEDDFRFWLASGTGLSNYPCPARTFIRRPGMHHGRGKNH
jgi:hypothetical protein